MSHVLLVPTAQLADARRLMWALGLQPENGTTFIVELDGYHAAHSWGKLLPDDLPDLDWVAYGLTAESAEAVLGLIAEDTGQWSEQRFLTALEQAHVAPAWVQPTPGINLGYPVGAVVAFADTGYRNTLPANFFQPDALNGGWVIAWASDEEPNWAPNIQYLAGRIVRGNERRYQAKIAEFSGAGREPWSPVMHAVWEDLGLIEEPAPGTPAWQAGIPVVVGELYTFNGRTYRVIQSHTTQAGWTPPVVPALFADEGPIPA